MVFRELRKVLWEKLASSPFLQADAASHHALRHSLKGDRAHPNYHNDGVRLHNTAMKTIGAALEQARLSKDIEAERHYKQLFVRHQDFREAHRKVTAPPAEPYESVVGFAVPFKLEEPVQLKMLIEEIREALGRWNGIVRDDDQVRGDRVRGVHKHGATRLLRQRTRAEMKKVASDPEHEPNLPRRGQSHWAS